MNLLLRAVFTVSTLLVSYASLAGGASRPVEPQRLADVEGTFQRDRRSLKCDDTFGFRADVDAGRLESISLGPTLGRILNINSGSTYRESGTTFQSFTKANKVVRTGFTTDFLTTHREVLTLAVKETKDQYVLKIDVRRRTYLVNMFPTDGGSFRCNYSRAK